MLAGKQAQAGRDKLVLVHRGIALISELGSRLARVCQYFRELALVPTSSSNHEG